MDVFTAIGWVLGGMSLIFLGLLLLYIGTRLVTAAYFQSRNQFHEEKAKKDGV